MKIAFDAKRIFNNSTGLGNYARTLVENLAQYYPNEEYHLFTPYKKLDRFDQILEDNSSIKVHMPAGGKLSNNIWRSFGINKDLADMDIFHGLSNEIPFTGFKAKKIVTIHDLIFKRYPEYYPMIDRMSYDFKFHYACNNADLVIAISEQTKKDIMEYYKVPVSKIKVLYQTCDRSFYQSNSIAKLSEVRTKYDLPPEYLLYVGTIEERKNALTIIKALNYIKGKTNISLIMVGKGGKYKDQVIEEVKNKGLEDRVRFLQDVSFADLPKIYQMAKIFIYPSLFEGFGIPIIEALFTGTPVITSNISCLPEAAGPDQVLIDPLDEVQMGNSILKLLEDKELYNETVKKGMAYVQRFHEENLTNQLHEIYSNI